MRLFAFPVTGLLALLFVQPLKDTGKKMPRKNPSVNESRWSGQLVLEERFTGLTGNSTRHVTVSFVNALPTLYRDDATTDLNFSDDKGRGNVTYHSESIIGGKKVSITDCEGSGPSELHEVSIDESDNTYSIHAIGPACNGTSVSLLDGKTEPYGPELTDIIVSSQFLADKSMLAGTKSEVIDLGGDLGTVTRTITWSLSQEITDAVFIITPENYDNWIPEPGINELSKGNSIRIGLKISGRNGPPVSKVKTFEVTLSNTSAEPGITLNTPLVPLTTLPDLRFLPQRNAAVTDEFQKASIQCNNGINDSITITSYDGGGYSTLSATAVLEDNTRLEGHLLIANGPTAVPVPKRPAHSNIGTAWLVANQNPSDLDDIESSAGNNNNGDGLTAYEEYRGVISNGRHKRLDPKLKELGVLLRPNQSAYFRTGIEWFENSTQVKIIRFTDGEIGADRQLNKNHQTAHSYDQYALRLVNGHIREGVMGRAVGGPGLPKMIKRVIVDVNQISQFVQNLHTAAARVNLQIPFDFNEMLANVTAHELGHGVSIPHHGNHALDTINKMIHAGDPYRIFRPRGASEILQRDYHLKGSYGHEGGQQSGDIFCIMCYNPYYDFAARQVGNIFHFYLVPFTAYGADMCTDPAGTDYNATGNYFGDATNGNCKSRIKLK